MSLKSINPYTNEIIREFEEFTDEEVEKRIKKSADAFEKWKRTSFVERKMLMINVSQTLNENKRELASAITAEMGKPIRESLAEIEKCAWVCEYYAVNAESFLSPEPVATDAQESFVCYEPLGTILGIMPWNFPFWQVFRFAIPALMAGNAVLLKHASNVQNCAEHIENIFSSAGFPDGLLINLVLGSGKIQGIIENDVVKAVSLTGSETAGRKVAETAGGKIKKAVLELGGSNAFIVLEDADIEEAVSVGITARMQNAGQSCIAAKRFIVHENISEKFIAQYSEKLSALRSGDPRDENTDIGPLSSHQQAQAVEEQVKKSVEMGARILLGGYPEGTYYPPTLLTDVKPGMPVFDEEVFGPVTPVIIAKDTAMAVSLSNQSSFGLGVSLFTNDNEQAKKLIPDFNEGAVFINALVKSDPRLPFGGIKNSGFGRELALHGIREFVNVKTVYIGVKKPSS